YRSVEPYAGTVPGVHRGPAVRQARLRGPQFGVVADGAGAGRAGAATAGPLARSLLRRRLGLWHLAAVCGVVSQFFRSLFDHSLVRAAVGAGVFLAGPLPP